MAVSRAQKFRLGVFLAAGLTLSIGGLVVLAGLELGEQRDAYEIRFAQAGTSLSGLDVGSPVKYSGIDIGRVHDIRVDSADVSVIVVAVSLEGGTPVAEDSEATLGYLGITGLKYVELSRGSPGARIREPGEAIPEGPSMLEDLTAQAARITRQTSELLDRLNSLASDDMRDRVERIMTRTEKLMVTTQETVDANRARIERLVDNVAEMTAEAAGLMREFRGSAERVNLVIDDARPRLNRMLASTNQLMLDLRASRDGLDTLVGDARTLVQTANRTVGDEKLGRAIESTDRLLTRGFLLLAETRDDIEEAVQQLRETAENMQVFSQRVKEDPSLLFLGSEDDGEQP